MYFTNPQTRSATQGAIDTDTFTTTFGTQNYTRANLVGVTLLEVFYGGQTLQTRIAPADYTFNSTTGTITFVIVVNNNIEANVLYVEP